MPTEPVETDRLTAAVTEVSDKLSLLVREEIELAKTEVTTKAKTLGRGAAAAAVGAVFGVFALIFILLTIAWGLNSVFNSIWIGFAIVMVVLILLTIGAFLFAYRKFQVGPPAPTMALEEAKKTRETLKLEPGPDS